MTGATLTRPLSEAEKQLVSRYHNLIYRVMGDIHIHGDAASDLYGEAALALVLAAQRYVTDDSLQRYRFTTIAYSRIRTSLLRERRRICKQPQTLSLDAVNDAGVTLYDVLPDTAAVDPADLPTARPPMARSHRLYALPAASRPGREAA